jgi:hypothetical protein
MPKQVWSAGGSIIKNDQKTDGATSDASGCAAGAISTNIQFSIFNSQFPDKSGFTLRSNRLVRVVYSS